MQIELIARAVILNGKKILLCRPAGKNWYFFPGGHVEFGEDAARTVEREISEETGAVAGSPKLIGTIENIYRADSKARHEINLFFRVSLKQKKIESRENHIAFDWVPISQLPKIRLMPAAAKQLVAKWLRDKKAFNNFNL